MKDKSTLGMKRNRDSEGSVIEKNLSYEQKEILQNYLIEHDIENQYFKAEDLPDDVYDRIKNLSEKKNVCDAVNNFIGNYLDKKKKGNRDYYFDMPPERIMRSDFEEFLRARKEDGFPEWNGGFKEYVYRERMIRMENKEDHVRDQFISGKLDKEKYGLTDHDIEINSHRFMKAIMEVAKNEFTE